MNANLQILVERLKKNNLSFRILDEKTTMISSRDVEKVFAGDPEEIWKTIIVTDEHSFFAAFLCGRDRLDLRKLEKALGVNGLRLAKAKELKERLRLQPGEVCPLSISLPVISDSSVNNFQKINFGSGDVSFGIEMQVDDVLKFLKPKVIDIKEGIDR
ncbi:MAG: YbaK/EbsC family protein [Candidatus Aenigmarchaeota archaeon]|nr:YbaK/EbsC family protein [Candidatus Aenigmarchaeota archaeon]